MIAVLFEAHWRCAVSCEVTVEVGGRSVLMESAALSLVVVVGRLDTWLSYMRVVRF